ncbi:MAG: 50S ribosomal protein L24 [Alphaproteobacteria bacterium]|nr:50S ribosomal protein L24 [Alphaproteobacteria bacterium]
MAAKLKIKKKDHVVIIAGKDKGKTGEVTAVMPKENRVIVSGVNMIARHTRPSQQNPQGGIVRREAAIHVSNVAHVDPKNKKPTRVGFKMVKDRKVRVARRSGEAID